MTDDIVTRLRIPLPWMLKGMTTKQLGDERREAVDEIESLRNENKYLKSLLVQSIPAETLKEMFSMKETIHKLTAEVAYLKTPCPRCDYEEEN